MRSWGIVFGLVVVVVSAWIVQQFIGVGIDTSGAQGTDKLMLRNEVRLKKLNEGEPQLLLDQGGRTQNAALEQRGQGFGSSGAAPAGEEDLDNLIRQFWETISTVDDSVSVASSLAHVLVDEARYEESINLLYELRLSVSQDLEPRLMTEIAVLVSKIEKGLEEQRDYQQLIYLYQLLVNLHSDHADYYLRLAHWQVMDGDVSGAETSLLGLANDVRYAEEVAAIEKSIEERKQPREKIIPLIKKGEQFLVNTKLNEIHEVSLLLDTGASRTVIKEQLVDSFGLETSGEALLMNTANGQVPADSLLISSFDMSGYAISELNVVTLPLPDFSYDGVVGMDVLSQFQFTIDQEKAVLIIR